MKYETKRLDAILKERLSEKRYRHTVNVANECRKLAKRYGADAEQAYFAGLAHDVCKEDPKEQQYEWAMASGMDVCAEEQAAFKVWHGIAGAYYLRTFFDVTDEDVLNAVRYHTIGRDGMSLLEKIVYMADMISEERHYKGVEKLRQVTYDNLDLSILYTMRYSVGKLLKNCSPIPPATIRAYNEYTMMFPKDTEQFL